MKSNPTIKRIIIVIAIYLIAELGISLVMGNAYEDNLLSYDNQSEYTSEDISLEVENQGLITMDKLWDEDGVVKVCISAVKGGSSGDAYVQVTDRRTGEDIELIPYHVAKTGVITNMVNGNFSNYRISHLLIFLELLAIAAVLLFGYVETQRKLRYSYDAIFCLGFGIWVGITTALIGYSYVAEFDMMNTYSILKGAAQQFVNITFPIMSIFAIALAISNISLIRHEGFCVSNALGLGVAAAIILGWLMLIVLDNSLASGSETQMRIYGSITATLYCIYALLECFLIGSVVCGQKAAHSSPAYDKKFIVVLGCKVKPDGSLYPLIRGRVDKAIAFAEAQQSAGGPAAYLVPSGGQGSDETISEGEAMKRYMLENGIQEDRIIAECEAKNTRENLLFSKRLADEKLAELGQKEGKMAFSTTNYHVFRSGIISGQLGLDMEGMGSRTKWYFWPNAYIREVIGMLSYKWKTMILIFVPIVIFLVVIQFTF